MEIVWQSFIKLNMKLYNTVIPLKYKLKIINNENSNTCTGIMSILTEIHESQRWKNSNVYQQMNE